MALNKRRVALGLPYSVNDITLIIVALLYAMHDSNTSIIYMIIHKFSFQLIVGSVSIICSNIVFLIFTQAFKYPVSLGGLKN